MKFVRQFVSAVAVSSLMLWGGVSHAVNFSANGVGEVAIAPYYTVRNGWLTAINLTNVSNKAIAVKVRFRESRNSRDTLDFTVGLSAFDVFTAVLLERKADGKAVLVVTDQENEGGRASCVIPKSVMTNSKLPTSSKDYGTMLLAESYGGDTTGLFVDTQNERDGGVFDDERLKEGYVEFYALGAADVTTFEDSAGNPVDFVYDYDADPAEKTAPLAIENHDCDYLDNAFSRRFVGPNNAGYGVLDRGNVYPTFTHYGTASEFGEPINALKFNVRLINPLRGLEAGYEAETLANFYNPQLVDGAVSARHAFDAAGNLIGVTGNNRNCWVNIGDQREIDPIDWRPDGDDSADGTPGELLEDFSCRNFIAEQDVYAFLEPSLNNAFPEVANIYDEVLNVWQSLSPERGTYPGANLPNDVRGIDAVSALFTRRFVVNEWSSDVESLVKELTDWVVTFPTKNFYVDSTGAFGYGAQQAIAPGVFDRENDGRYETADVLDTPFRIPTNLAQEPFLNTSRPESLLKNSSFAPFVVGENDIQARIHSAYPPFAELFDGESCLEAGVVLYDRAEQPNRIEFGDGVTISPAPPASRVTVELCAEANILTFNGRSVFRSADVDEFLGVGDDDIETVDISNPSFNSTKGWMQLDLNFRDSDDGLEKGPGATSAYLQNASNAFATMVPIDAPNGVKSVRVKLEGAPALGFAIKQRTFGPDNAKSNFASAITHSYTRSICDPLNVSRMDSLRLPLSCEPLSQ